MISVASKASGRHEEEAYEEATEAGGNQYYQNVEIYEKLSSETVIGRRKMKYVK